MSIRLRVGIVCEGGTDFAVLQEVVSALVPCEQVVLLQPDYDRLEPGPGPGWQGVRRFLQESGEALRIGTFQVVVVHVDADLADLPEIARELVAQPGDPPAGLDALCRLVQAWFRSGVPDSVVVVLPRRSTAAWLVAAQTHRHGVEEIEEPDEYLADRGFLERRGDRAHKTDRRYRELAAPLPALLRKPKALRAIPELDRFAGKVRERARRLRKAAA